MRANSTKVSGKDLEPFTSLKGRDFQVACAMGKSTDMVAFMIAATK